MEKEKTDVLSLTGKGILQIICFLLIAWILFIFAVFITQNIGLLRVFIALLYKYNLSFVNFEWLDFIIGLIGCVAFWFLGKVYIRIFDVYLPRFTEEALAFTLGIGIIAFAMELATMARLHYQIVAILIYLILLVIGFVLERRKTKKLFPTSVYDTSRYINRKARIQFAREQFELTLFDMGPIEKIFYYIMLTIIVIISILTFYHAVFFPITYWDALILYGGYARMIFYQHAFPFKATAQVGIGLGANYPHLYPILSATIATVVNRWNDLYVQITPPIAMIFATVLIYSSVLRISRRKIYAASAALLFRAIPYNIAYSQYASDYAFSILFTAAFLYLALELIDTKKYTYFILASLMCAFATHINYLMWLLWGGLIFSAILTFFKYPKITQQDIEKAKSTEEFDEKKYFDEQGIKINKEIDFLINKNPPSVFGFFFGKVFITTFIITMLIASTWYIRNWVLTGNPVYAFFPKIFGGININEEVLKSAEVEWMRNGDGLWRVGNTLSEKIRGSWRYFVVERSLAWKVAPVFVAFCLTGTFVFIITFFLRLIHGDEFPMFKKRIFIFDNITKFYLVCLLIFGLFLFYEYAIASIYLYQVIAMLVPAVILSIPLIDVLYRHPVKYPLKVIIIIIGIFPGIAMGLMGFKFKSMTKIGNQVYHQLDLVAFRNPCMDKKMFLTLVYGDDIKMAEYINQNLKGTKILTHENRHLLYDPSITLIHLDDWEIQKTYTMKSDDEKMSLFKSLGITHYLYIPNEDNHEINKRVGLTEWKEENGKRELFSSWASNGRMSLILRAGDNRLFKFNYPKSPDEEKPKKPDLNKPIIIKR